jgi:hypothetical protein
MLLRISGARCPGVVIVSHPYLFTLLIAASFTISASAAAQERAPTAPDEPPRWSPSPLWRGPSLAPPVSEQEGPRPTKELRGLNGERLDFAHTAELAGWLGFMTMMTSAPIMFRLVPEGEPIGALEGAVVLFGVPALVAGSTLLIFDEGITSGAAQAVNSVSIWATVNLLAFEELLLGERDTVSSFGAVALVGWAGVGVGALAYHLLEPSGGRIAAINSGGLLSLGVHTALSLGFDGQLYGDAAGMVLMNSGLVAGLLLHSLRPLSREEMFLADGVGLLSGLLGVFIGARASGEAPGGMAIGWSIASVAGFTTAYLLLSAPDEASPEPAAGVGVSLVAGDALYHEPGRPQGGAGLMLNLAW